MGILSASYIYDPALTFYVKASGEQTVTCAFKAVEDDKTTRWSTPGFIM